jgi:hypothetical protein
VVPASWFIRSAPLPPGCRHEPADIAGVTWLNYSLLRRSGSAPGEMIFDMKLPDRAQCDIRLLLPFNPRASYLGERFAAAPAISENS